MTVTIELKPKTEKHLAEKAKQNGLPIETYIEFFLENLPEKETENGAKEKSSNETAVEERKI